VKARDAVVAADAPGTSRVEILVEEVPLVAVDQAVRGMSLEASRLQVDKEP